MTDRFRAERVRRTLAPLAAAAVFGLALVATVGCGSTEPAIAGTCTSNSHCSAGVCDVAAGRCIPRADKATALVVRPPNSNNQGWVLQEFAKPAIGPDGVVKLQLRKTVSLQGIVYASHAEKVPLPARLTFWRKSTIPGRADVSIEVRATGEQRGKTNTGGPPDKPGYQVWLEPGHSFTVLVSPEPPFDKQYPPVVHTVKLDDHQGLDLALHGDDTAVRVTGRVQDAAGKPLPFPVQVRAFKEGTWRRSTLGLTCTAGSAQGCVNNKYEVTDDGTFSVRIPPGVETYTMRVEPLPPQTGSGNQQIPAVPTVRCEGRVLGLVDASSSTPLQEIKAPLRMPPFSYAKRFSLTVVAKDNHGAVAGARVTFRAAMAVATPAGFSSCSAEYSYAATTDAKGRVEVPLLPGDAKPRSYSVTVVTPSGSAYASRRLDVQVGNAGGVLQSVELDKRYELTGTVVSKDGTPVVGALIEARGVVETSYGGGTPLPAGEASTSSDAEGKFVLHVDPGVYDFHIEPTETSQVPHFWLRGRKVDQSTFGLKLTAPASRVLVGRLVDAAGKAAPGFTVTALDADGSVRRAQSRSDGDGTFRLLLAE